ncbi:dockerin type I domain-containing protein [Ruminococcus flavefaciens]|uniref:dockerin type I domain-containing protein n=1 Tax=Ruminococcus flavefaciens TaxID=1265 RepID=UPI0026F07F14|nr:dockerin type I domain-containing protein [Ruminococcus flavefaciens]
MADTSVIQQGDVNCDGHINAVDASIVLSNYAEHQTSDAKFNGCNSLGDINEDGELNAIDASEILSTYAHNSVS